MLLIVTLHETMMSFSFLGTLRVLLDRLFEWVHSELMELQDLLEWTVFPEWAELREWAEPQEWTALLEWMALPEQTPPGMDGVFACPVLSSLACANPIYLNLGPLSISQ